MISLVKNLIYFTAKIHYYHNRRYKSHITSLKAVIAGKSLISAGFDIDRILHFIFYDKIGSFTHTFCQNTDLQPIAEHSQSIFSPNQHTFFQFSKLARGNFPSPGQLHPCLTTVSGRSLFPEKTDIAIYCFFMVESLAKWSALSDYLK